MKDNIFLKNCLSKIKNNKFIIIIILLLFLILGIGIYLFFSSDEYSKKDLIIQQNSMVSEFDCHSKSLTLYDSRMLDIIHESLTAYNYDTKKYEPRGLVDSCEEIKDPQDNNIIIGYKFILKPNIKFHNKEILKPSDILYTFQRGLEKDPDNVILGKLDIEKIKESKNCDDVNNTITIYYKKDFDTSNMFFELSRVYILNKKACEKDNLDGCKIGLGFFSLSKWKTNSADEVILKRFDDFYDNIKNNFERIIFKKFPDNVSAIQDINSTKYNTILLDIKSNSINPGILNDKIEKIPVHGYSSRFLMLNCPNTKKHVRKLIAQSLDMEKIFSELEVNREYYFVPKNFIYDPDFKGYESNPQPPLRDSQKTFEETQKEVKALESKERQIKFLQPQLDGISKIILEKILFVLREVGFDVEHLQEPDFNLMLKSCSKPDSKHNIVYLGNNWNNHDPSEEIKSYFYVSNLKTEGLDKLSFFQNSEFEQLIQNIDKIDKITKEERLKKIGKILSEHMPVYPIVGEKSGATQILFNKNIKDVKNYMAFIDLKNVYFAE
ncbi:MAG: ABC transporter substrate-binding protein [Candidatus Phytoplasma pyri]